MKIRLRTICILLAALLPWSAHAETVLTLSAELTAAFSPVDFTVSGEEAPLYRYTLLYEGKQLFETETPYAFGSYVPRKTGTYQLKAAALRKDGEETVEASFTAAEVLSMSLAPLPETVPTGEPLKVHVQTSGGAGGERYVYSILAQKETVLRTEGGADWYWVPAQPGVYTLLATVLDAGGAAAKATAAFDVVEGNGLSAEATGGDLSAGGGQKSWIIYAAEEWTAQTESDFLTLEQTSGASGDVLTATISTPTDEYREASILLRSGLHQLTLTAAQSAGYGVDEEVSLFETAQPLTVEGQTHVVWTNAQGSRAFGVEAAGEWRAETQDAFIQLEQNGNELVVHTELNDAASVRSGLVTIGCDGGSAYLHLYQSPALPAVKSSAAFDLPEAEPLSLYSQSSGLWKDKKYGSSNLQTSGCAIFALSHALQCLGFEGDVIAPEALAKKYAFCLREDGTINSTLVGNAGDDLGFQTRYELYHDLRTIRSRFGSGAVFSFAVVNGHIAMAAQISEDGSMVQVIDSAPSATWERIGDHQLYLEQDGSFSPIGDLSEIPGIRYYPENGAFGAAAYWLESSYVAKRGLRLIQPEE